MLTPRRKRQQICSPTFMSVPSPVPSHSPAPARSPPPPPSPTTVLSTNASRLARYFSDNGRLLVLKTSYGHPHPKFVACFDTLPYDERVKCDIFVPLIPRLSSLSPPVLALFSEFSLPIEVAYASRVIKKSDINEHLPMLASLARQCTSVCELGVRGVVSSYALLYGLSNRTAISSPASLFMCDITPVDLSGLVSVNPADSRVTITFRQGNDLEIALPSSPPPSSPPSSPSPSPSFPFNMTFIDTLHVYGQLKRELARYAPLTSTYLVMHDTTVDGEVGEVIRNKWDAEKVSASTSIPVEELNRGLWPAVEEFLSENKEWRLLNRLHNNNGLTILHRYPPHE